MRVEVQYLAQIKRALGRPGEAIELPAGATVGDLLRDASVLVSRVGGVGGTVALYLAAAGVGRLVLAHRGDLRIDDLNRQILMRDERLGSSRVSQAAERLRDLDPRLVVETVGEN